MQIKAIYRDAFAFTEPHRKSAEMTRLTIACHGLGDEIEIDNRHVTPEDLAQTIRHWTSDNRLRSVRLVACHTADLPPASYAQRLDAEPRRLWSTAFGARLSAALPGITVRCYAGEVTATCDHDLIWQTYQRLGPAFTAEKLAQYFAVIKNDPAEHYHSIAFRDGVAVKQAYTIIREDGRDYAML